MKEKVKINFMSLLALSLVLFTVGSAWAQPENMRRGYNKDRASERMSELNLSEAQQEEVKNLRMEHKENRETYVAQLKEKRATLKMKVTEDAPDHAAINELIEEIGAINTALEKSRVAQRLNVRALLDDEQKAVFDARKSGKERHGEGHKKNRGRRG